MRINAYILFAVVFSLLSALHGCAEGKRPFLMVQMCLKDEPDLVLFSNMMESIAKSERMDFTDNSTVTQGELTSIYRKLDKENPNVPAINIFVLRRDGMGLGAGNLGLPRNQIALGFSEGSDPSEARRFADMVVSKLKAQWPVVVVPAGKGALPLAQCSGS